MTSLHPRECRTQDYADAETGFYYPGQVLQHIGRFVLKAALDPLLLSTTLHEFWLAPCIR